MDSVYGMLGAAGGCGWQLCPLGWLIRWLWSLTFLFLCSRIAACSASWSHCRFYTLSAFKQYGLQQSCVLFPYQYVVNEKGCQCLSG